MSNMEPIIFTLITISLAFGVSYLLALAGAPQSSWLWGDVLGFMEANLG